MSGCRTAGGILKRPKGNKDGVYVADTKNAGLGNEPRKVLEELSRLQVADVVLPTRCGKEIRHRCVMRPDAHQTILLDRLKLKLPDRVKMPEM